jgi:hypothetical protein
MGRKRRLYRIAPDVYLLAPERPRKVAGPEAERVLRGMLAARQIGLGFTLTPQQRKERARRAAAARWGKRRRPAD